MCLLIKKKPKNLSLVSVFSFLRTRHKIAMARDSCLARVTAGAAVGGAVGGAVGQLSTSSYNFIYVILTANCNINFFPCSYVFLLSLVF